MSQVEIADAAADLRAVVERARDGEDVTIVDGGRAVARIVAVPPQQEDSLPPRQLGRLKGRFRVPEDFDAPLPDDLLDMFEGKA